MSRRCPFLFPLLFVREKCKAGVAIGGKIGYNEAVREVSDVRVIDLKHPGEAYALPDGGCGLCLGHFDGVHIGHTALIDALKEANKQRAFPLPLGAMCFAEPPAVTLMKEPTPQITTLEHKLRLLGAAGLSFAVLYDFPAIMGLSPLDFVADVLIRDCNCRLAACGFNYRFGAGGRGTPEDLARLFGTQQDRRLVVAPPVMRAGRPVSSSIIRTLLENGHPDDAARLLGRPFLLEGTVENGRHVGRVLEAPTANLMFPHYSLIPAHGVYAVLCKVGKRTYRGVCNVGTRPTFESGGGVVCEVHLFDFSGDLYGRRMEVAFMRFLRPERAFDSAAALKKQIEADIEQAKEVL